MKVTKLEEKAKEGGVFSKAYLVRLNLMNNPESIQINYLRGQMGT